MAKMSHHGINIIQKTTAIKVFPDKQIFQISYEWDESFHDISYFLCIFAESV